ncbi:ATP-binding protein [Paenarthrobacter sp. PH39-S1]|uniref:sensor histidine kinase n=1 Tax=Paenarthrobacter sp. PH39-S1 TaxID=3046204 RepID=UPI0024BAD480|nr:ATP-binding protein [Paenarthrobacter sp. PH39-S1]MDJ0356106.1 ATP-binding protein [Paenarthrobacter sp. PH39-S1]
MSKTSPNALITRYFYQRSLRMRVVLSQLPLTITVLLIVGLSAAFQPEVLRDPLFQIGLWGQGIVLFACLLIPWGRLPYPSFLVIPYLDFIAVGFSRQGSATTLSGLGLLALFPVFWLAASGLARRCAVIGGTLATLLMVWVPIFLAPGPITTQQLSRPVVLPLMMLAFAITVAVITTSMDAQRVELEAKDAELRSALEASHDRERLLDDVVNTVSVGLVAVDADGHDVLLNRKQRTFHGLAAPDGNADPAEAELLIFAADGSTPLAPQDRPVFRAVQGESFSQQLIWVGQNGGARALSATARPRRDINGGFAGSVVAFYDVTELVSALATKDDFVSNISHELRTPLTSILGYLGLALDDPSVLTKEVVQYLQVAERNADRLLSLVTDLLSTASRTMEIKPRLTNLSDIIEDSLDSAGPPAAENGVTLLNDGRQPLMAMLDVGRIGQVLDNLISNAIKYSPDGGTVTVRARTVDGSAVCEVQDTGIGMDSDEQAGAFSRFFRAGGARSRAIPGVGLGLLISKTIVENHGGRMHLQSERDVGTTIGFTIPLHGPGSAVGPDPAAELTPLAVLPG